MGSLIIDASLSQNFFKSRIVYFVLVILLSSSCAKYGMNRSLGLFLNNTHGNFFLAKDDNFSDTKFILCVSSEFSFIEFDGRQIYKKSAKIYFVDVNSYHIEFEVNVKLKDCYFIAKSHETSVYRFENAIMMERVYYDVTLVEDLKWEKNYIFNLKPLLISVIENKNYELPKHDVVFLENWMLSVEKDIL